MLRTPDNTQTVSPIETGSENSQNGHVTLKARKDWRQIIRKPLLYAVILGALTFVICTFLPKKYQVMTTLYFPSAGGPSIFSAALGKGNADQGSVALLNNALSSPEVASSPQMAIALLNSTTCNTQVARDCDLPKIWGLSMDDTLEKLSKVSSFDLDKNGLLDVTVSDTNPRLAVKIAKSFTDNVTIQADNVSNGFAHENTAFIENRILLTTQDLHAKEKLLAKLESSSHDLPAAGAEDAVDTSGDGGMAAEASGLSGLASQAGMPAGAGMGGSSGAGLSMGSSTTSAYGSSYVALVAERNRLRAAVDGTKAALSKAKQQAQTELKQGSNLPADVPAGAYARDNLHELQAKLEDARKTLGPDNPDYRSLSLQVATAQNEFNAEMQREKTSFQLGITPRIAGLEAQLIEQQAVLDNFNQQVKTSTTTLSKLPSFQTRLVNLKYQVATDFELLKLQRANLELAIDAENRNMPTFRVVDPAVVPNKPDFPKRGLSTILAFILGALIGVLSQSWPTLRQQWNSAADPA